MSRRYEDETTDSALDYLASQHREIEALFEALDSAENSAEKQDLFDTLADTLTIHTRIEEQYFYPAVRERKTDELVMEAFGEHTGIKRLLADMLETDPDDTLFDAKLAVLREQVERHVEEEENDLFPAARRLLSRDELLAVASEMAALQDDLEGTDPRNDLPGQLAEQPAQA